MPTLYLLPTVLAPDTQKSVLAPEVITCIQNTKIFFAENIKTTRRHISALGLGIVIDDLTFHEIDAKTKENELFEILSQNSDNLAVISESGCPGVADPGAMVVEMAHQLNYTVRPLVGPSSILLSLMASGLNGQSFSFHGYLPIEEKDREKRLKSLENISLQQKQTQLFIETPYRNKQILAALLKVLNPNTQLCIACNITAEDEFIKTGSISYWRKLSQLPDLHKKPCMFLFLA
ncbi:MAG: SAM-dependent methyltransferase [Leadbetterella sp.]